MSQAAEIALKILIIGPSNVGKSALLKRYCDDEFDPNDAAATIGIDFRVKRLSVHGKTCRVTLLDTAGQERFRTLSTSYYRGAHGIIFVYDLTSRATFAQMDTWFAEAEANTAGTGTVTGAGTGGGSGSTLPCQYCLVAAKADRADTSRAVSAEEGLALARKYAHADNRDDTEPLFFETSARTGDVRRPFVALVNRIVASGVEAGSRPSGTGAVFLRGSSEYIESYIPGCAC